MAGQNTPKSQGFRYWLRQQKHRQDPVGDLARDFERDTCMPKPKYEDLTVFEAHMKEHDALDSAILALWRAWAEFLKAEGRDLMAGHV